MSTNIHIPKKCQYCGTIFIARTTTTRYCTHKCNSRHYKQLLKEKKVAAVLAEAIEQPLPSSEATIVVASDKSSSHAPSFNKEFYSMRETALLLGVHERTIMNMVWNGKLPHGRIGRRVIIQKAQVLELFKLSAD
jgi:excisionase family DNA binding protein